MVLRWLSASNRSYGVSRATNWTAGFVSLATNLAATPRVYNSYTDVGQIPHGVVPRGDRALGRRSTDFRHQQRTIVACRKAVAVAVQRLPDCPDQPSGGQHPLRGSRRASGRPRTPPGARWAPQATPSVKSTSFSPGTMARSATG